MICELCGREIDRPLTVYIEGSKLTVGPECSRFGDAHNGGKAEEGSRIVIEERLQRRERRMRGRDVYATSTVDLAEDYPQRIKEARRKRGWDQDALGAKLNEKKSVVTKLESGNMVPSDKLVKKLERTLGIELMEKTATAAPSGSGSQNRGLTLGDMIKTEKK